jgi:hypothetical protein
MTVLGVAMEQTELVVVDDSGIESPDRAGKVNGRADSIVLCAKLTVEATS